MESIVDKIKKLLALAKDATDEESTTAMVMAQKLMLKHNLSLDDIHNQKERRKTTPTVADEIVISKKILWWQKHLAVIISKNFRCYTYKESAELHKSNIRFVGKQEDVDIATTIYLFAVESIKYHSTQFLNRKEIKRKYKTKHQYKNDYIVGYLNGMIDKFDEQIKNECLELMLVKDDAVEEYMGTMLFAPKKESEPKRAMDGEAVHAGYKDGKRFDNERVAIED